jgi:ABC-2 type transport system permease protein
MLRNVFTKSLLGQRRALVGWSIGIALLVLLEASLWSSIRNMPGFDEGRGTEVK